MASVRLQKILSAAGVASRRAAEVLMAQGRVSVNGSVVRELGTRADPTGDDIRVDGRRIAAAARLRYILLNKPAGVVSTRSDPEGRPTVLGLLRGVREYLYPVGRLDYDSEGLLLLTNDGELAARLMHPRFGVEKTYDVVVRGHVEPPALRALAGGVTIDGRRTAPARVHLLRTLSRRGRDATRLEVTIHEGRNRQVRRMCETVGHPVERLARTRIGPLADGDLAPGQWRDLTPREVDALKSASGLETPTARQPDHTRRGPKASATSTPAEGRRARAAASTRTRKR